MNIKISSQSVSLSFKNAIMETNSLNNFLDSSINSIENKEEDFKKKYKYGIALADAFDSVFEEKNFEDQKRRVEEIKDIPLNESSYIKDIVDITISESDSIDGTLNKILFNMKKRDAYKYYNPEKVRSIESMINNQKRLLAQSILSSIVIIFETYLSEVYELLIIGNHNEYLKDKQIYINQIFCEDINEIIHNTVQHEVEQRMYDSLATLDLIKEKSKFNIDRYCNIRKRFEEIYYRRNIYVHNKGVVNEIYMSKVDKSFSKGLKIGKYAECSKKYLYEAIRVLKIVLSTMYYELLNVKLCDDPKLYVQLADVGFESLCESEYDIAEHIYNVLRNHREFKYIDKAMYQVNYINALKQQRKEYLKELQQFDVSIATDNFKIAKMCLEDKFEDAYDLIVKTYPKSFTASDIRDWPLFIDFRKTEYYEKFKNDHIEDFNEFVFEDNQLLENMDVKDKDKELDESEKELNAML